MSEVTVKVTLPFPLRVGSRPYSIRTEETTWSLHVHRIQKRPMDPRLATGGNLDLVIDRHGLLSYSQVTGQSDLNSTTQHVIRSFLNALNDLIENFRDKFGVFWVRRLESEDLFEVEVSDLHGGELLRGGGRTGGFFLPNLGLGDAAHSQLQFTLSRNRRPPVWREIELDAQDALEQGRYEEAALLAWSALESGCRHALPGLAWREDISVRELEQRLRSRQSKKRPALSLEEAVERSSGLTWLRATVELFQPGTFDQDSLLAEADEAYLLRNRVIHSGVRLHRHSTMRAVNSCRFILKNLDLRDVEQPPLDASWQKHFGVTCLEIRQFLKVTGSRVMLFNPAREAGTLPGWRIELIDRDWRIHLPLDMPETVAAAQLITEADSWNLRRDVMRPHIRWTGDELPYFLPGLSKKFASIVEHAVWHSHAIRAQDESTIATEPLAEFALQLTVDTLSDLDVEYDRNDIRRITIPIQLAAYASGLNEKDAQPYFARLHEFDHEISDRTSRWSNLLRSVDVIDRHSACAVFRALHGELFWLDTFVVDCPIEHKTYGSTSRDFRQ